MEFDNGMFEGTSPQGVYNSAQEGHASAREGYAMEVLIKDYRIMMAVACFTSLTLGLPLAINMLRQLKVNINLIMSTFPSLKGPS